MTQMPDTVHPIEPEFAEPPKWPKVVGIISIVWGALGFCCLGFGFVNAVMNGGGNAQGMSQAFPDGVPPQLGVVTPGMMASMALGTVTTVLLVIAGIVLTMRKPAARWLHLVYAVLAFAGAVWSIFQQMGIIQSLQTWVNDNSSTKFAQSWSMIQMTLYITLVVTILFSMVWPIFCFVWFGVVKKKPEEYTRGVEQLM